MSKYGQQEQKPGEFIEVLAVHKIFKVFKKLGNQAKKMITCVLKKLEDQVQKLKSRITNVLQKPRVRRKDKGLDCMVEYIR